MGTPEFAVPSLDILVKNGFDIRAVITAPDKPAGRGRKITQSALKRYALEKSIPVLQPINLKDPEFITQLKKLDANLQIVVAFRMLPEVIWRMPEHGTFNLHASLLPQYRGAAPINWAIINGETITGITTFFLNKEIDTGQIILQEKIKIDDGMNAGELHDQLMNKGAELVLKTVKLISSSDVNLTEQSAIINERTFLKTAPKIFKENTRIQWNKSAKEILNLINGLSPYPGAYTMIKNTEGSAIQLKIFAAQYQISDHKMDNGQIHSDGKTKFKIACTDGFVLLKEVQIAGKKRMNIEAFLKGFYINDGWIAE